MTLTIIQTELTCIACKRTLFRPLFITNREKDENPPVNENMHRPYFPILIDFVLKATKKVKCSLSVSYIPNLAENQPLSHICLTFKTMLTCCCEISMVILPTVSWLMGSLCLFSQHLHYSCKQKSCVL